MANPKGNPQNLTPWAKGVSGNPGGKPRKRPQSEANDAFLRKVYPEKMRRAMNAGIGEVLEPGCTWGDAISFGLGKKAVRGDSHAAKELRESVEGKSVARYEISAAENRNWVVEVEYADLPDAVSQRNARYDRELKRLPQPSEPIEVQPEPTETES